MVRRKLADITLEDVMSFAAENGIRKAKAVINEVADAIKAFRSLAKRHGVQERWIAAVENTLQHNLEAWGLSEPTAISGYTDGSRRRIEIIRIEQQFKGNYHLLATIDGREYKYIIRKDIFYILNNNYNLI